MYALEAQAENPDVVMHLIKKGADVNVVTIDHWTPLLKATQKQYHEILRRFIEKGAKIE
jgi:ankyrin repeat protein